MLDHNIDTQKQKKCEDMNIESLNTDLTTYQEKRTTPKICKWAMHISLKPWKRNCSF